VIAPAIDAARAAGATVTDPMPADTVFVPDIAAGFDAIVAMYPAASWQRRNTLRNALSALVDESSLRASGLDPGARGETLSVADFVRLANHAAASVDPNSFR